MHYSSKNVNDFLKLETWAFEANQKSRTFVILIWPILLNYSENADEIPSLINDFFNFDTSGLTIETNVFILFRIQQFSYQRMRIINELWEFYAVKTFPFVHCLMQTENQINGTDLMNLKSLKRRQNFNQIQIAAVSVYSVGTQ